MGARRVVGLKATAKVSPGRVSQSRKWGRARMDKVDQVESALLSLLYQLLQRIPTVLPASVYCAILACLHQNFSAMMHPTMMAVPGQSRLCFVRRYRHANARPVPV